MVTTIYIVRHCQSAGNIKKRFQGRKDEDISEDGAKQTELLGLRFRNEKIDAVYSSPLKRACFTAQAVSKYHNLPVIKMDGLIEMNAGSVEGLSLSEMKERYPGLAQDWECCPDKCVFPGGESMAEVYERAYAALVRITAENAGKTVIVVTHGGIIRNLYARIACGGIEGMRKGTYFGNTGVNLVECDESGCFVWKTVNDQSHLPGELISKPALQRSGGETV